MPRPEGEREASGRSNEVQQQQQRGELVSLCYNYRSPRDRIFNQNVIGIN